MKNEKVLRAFGEMSQSEYRLGLAIDDLKTAQQTYKNELIDDCIQNLLRLQEETDKLTERDLLIFLRDLVNKTSDVRVPR